MNQRNDLTAEGAENTEFEKREKLIFLASL